MTRPAPTRYPHPMTDRKTGVYGNNPRGNPQHLKQGNPKPGVPLGTGQGVRIRLPDQHTADTLTAYLNTTPRTRKAEELGRLIADGLKHRGLLHDHDPPTE